MPKKRRTEDSQLQDKGPTVGACEDSVYSAEHDSDDDNEQEDDSEMMVKDYIVDDEGGEAGDDASVEGFEDGAGGTGQPGKKGKGKKSASGKKGTFESLGLSREVFAGIKRMGYKLPTPIQRKSLPLALGGRDLVCMARTGSGKTAAFLIPVLERLKAHSHRVGARALILSPTRELAVQTVKFTKGLSKFTDLRVALLVGGDSMEDQFEALANNPDIIIGTPGRVMHHLQEVPDFSLRSVEMVVYDEADRLYEMGFAEQLQAISKSISDERQSLLFSATLPKMLAQFARAGLRDPVLIRLDVDTKISENLCLGFFTVRSGNKIATLLYLLREVLPRDRLTIIFAATKHHVEFLQEALREVGLPCSAIFGAMDFEARKLNLERFRTGKVKYLVVTDVAARGIDVPLLDFVINYSFPPSAKLFVHRVGRAARQGRSGAAFSLVDPEELAYMVDLHIFLARPVQATYKGQEYEGYSLKELTPDMVHYGGLPQHLLDEENESLRQIMDRNGGAMHTMWRVCENAMKQYRRTRPDPSRHAIQRAKDLDLDHVHPLLLGNNPSRVAGGSVEHMKARDDLVKHLQTFRPQQTILEVQKSDGGSLYKGLTTKRKSKLPQMKVDVGAEVMRNIRKDHNSGLKRLKEHKQGGKGAETSDSNGHQARESSEGNDAQETRDGASPRHGRDIEDGDHDVEGELAVKPKLSRAARKRLKRAGSAATAVGVVESPVAEGESKNKSAARIFRDHQHFIEYGVTEHDELVEKSFQPRSVEKDGEMLLANRLEEALLDVEPDEALEMAKKRRIMHWDARKKKFVRQTVAEMGEARGSNKLRTESGVVVSGKMLPKGELYRKWQKRTNKSLALAGGEEGDGDEGEGASDGETGGGFKRKSRPPSEEDKRFMGFKKFRHKLDRTTKVDPNVHGRKAKNELKSVAEIEKERLKKRREREHLDKNKNKGRGRSGGRGGGRGGGKRGRR